MYYYKCSGRKQNSGCKKEVVRKDFLEKIIFDKLLKCISNPDIIKKIVKELLRRQERLINENSLVKTLIKEEKQAQIALSNIVSAIENGVYNKTTQKRMQELETQIESLQSQIIVEKNKTVVRITEKDIRNNFKQALTLKPDMLIESFVQKIELFDDKIIIILNSPIQKSPDDDRGFLICEKACKLNLPLKHIEEITVMI